MALERRYGMVADQLSGYGPVAPWVAVARLLLGRVGREVPSPSQLLSSMSEPRNLGSWEALQAAVPGWREQLWLGLLRGDYELAWVNEHFFLEWETLTFYPKQTLASCVDLDRFSAEPLCESTKPASSETGAIQDRLCERVNQAVLARVQSAFSHDSASNVLIGITGSPGTGKSTLAASLLEALSGADISARALPQDGYFLSKVGREGKLGRDEFDMPRWLGDARHLRAHDDIPIEVSEYVHATHDKRVCPPLVASAESVIVVEGIFPFAEPETKDMYQLKIGFWVDDAERLRRMIGRCPPTDTDRLKLRHFQLNAGIVGQVVNPTLSECDVIIDVSGGRLLWRRAMR